MVREELKLHRVFLGLLLLLSSLSLRTQSLPLLDDVPPASSGFDYPLTSWYQTGYWHKDWTTIPYITLHPGVDIGRE